MDLHSDSAEALRKRYLYRRMILRGEVRLPRESAVPLVGPDCAYHLYAAHRSQQGPAPAEGVAEPEE
jgi:hypothetical protein